MTVNAALYVYQSLKINGSRTFAFTNFKSVALPVNGLSWGLSVRDLTSFLISCQLNWPFLPISASLSLQLSYHPLNLYFFHVEKKVTSQRFLWPFVLTRHHQGFFFLNFDSIFLIPFIYGTSGNPPENTTLKADTRNVALTGYFEVCV